jgi:4-alpha-glucanotransferase
VGRSLDLTATSTRTANAWFTSRPAARWRLSWTPTVYLPGMIPVGYHRAQIGEQHFTLAVAPARCYSIADATDSDSRHEPGA